MSIAKDGDVPLVPTYDGIQAGLLTQLFAAAPDNGAKLHSAGSNGSFKLKLLRADQAAAYKAYLLSQGWKADPNQAHQFEGLFLPRLKIGRIVCPWYQHDAVILQITVDFLEQEFFTDVFLNNAPTATFTFNWPTGQTTFTQVVTSNAVPFPRDGSNGPWSARITVFANIDPAGGPTFLDFTAELLSGGYDALSAGTVTETNIGNACANFVDLGAAIAFAWAAVGPPLPSPLIGNLNRSLNIAVRAIGFVN